MKPLIRLMCLMLSITLVGCASDPPATETVTVEQTTPSSAPESNPSPPPPPETSAAFSKKFSGSGIKSLPPFTLARDSTLRWTSSGSLFSIYDGLDDPSAADNPGIPVNSQASSGDTFVKSGKHSFQINADGDWTIRITPGS